MIENLTDGSVQKTRHPLRNRRWFWPVVITSVAVLTLLIGVGIGSAASSNASALNAAKRTDVAQRTAISGLNGQVSSLQAQASSLQAQLASAQSQAEHAMGIAEARAKSDYAARNATLNQKESTLTQQEKTVNTELGQLQASQINASGVYVVGKDIKSGTWHTPGDGGNNGGMSNACYFATLNSTDTSNIADNNNFDGSESVDLSGAYAFEISGPCTWYYTG
jgi:multidrug efflux pump subunit AcrA (membrane-fusion protein)